MSSCHFIFLHILDISINLCPTDNTGSAIFHELKENILFPFVGRLLQRLVIGRINILFTSLIGSISDMQMYPSIGKHFHFGRGYSNPLLILILTNTLVYLHLQALENFCHWGCAEWRQLLTRVGLLICHRLAIIEHPQC